MPSDGTDPVCASVAATHPVAIEAGATAAMVKDLR
jgi:hypothetical protein